MKRTLSDVERVGWAIATQDVRPLKGKRRVLRLVDFKALMLKPVKVDPKLKPPPRTPARALYDAKLDLHGLTETGAYQLLMNFIGQEIARGTRRLLIITGKGAGAGGALRAGVPRWLDVEPIASRVRSVETAPVGLGGEGAYLVTLKAKRR